MGSFFGSSGGYTPSYLGEHPDYQEFAKWAELMGLGNVPQFLSDAFGRAQWEDTTGRKQDAADEEALFKKLITSGANNTEQLSQTLMSQLNNANNGFNQASDLAKKGVTAGQGLYNQAAGDLTKAGNYIQSASGLQDPWDTEAAEYYRKAGNDTSAKNSSEYWENSAKQGSEQLKRLTETGEVSAPLVNALQYNTQTALNKSLGQSMGNYAGRGVVNSSLMGTTGNNIANAAANAFNTGYQSLYNTEANANASLMNEASNAGNIFGNLYNQNNANMIAAGQGLQSIGSGKANTALSQASGLQNNAAGLTSTGQSMANDYFKGADSVASNFGNWMSALQAQQTAETSKIGTAYDDIAKAWGNVESPNAWNQQLLQSLIDLFGTTGKNNVVYG